MIKKDENTKICVICNEEKSLSSFARNGTNNKTRNQCRVCVYQRLKLVVNPILKTKLCKACNVELDIKEFSKQQGIGDGYSARCKKCKIDGNLIPKDKKMKKILRPLTLSAPSLIHYINMYKLMENIGYSLKEDLHIQFCKKYGLTPNIPKKTFLHYFSQKDCGLI